MIRNTLRNRSGRGFAVIALATVAAASQAQTLTSLLSTGYGQNELVTYKGTDTFNNFVSGIELNSLIGANTFYSHGYTGTRSTVANVEGGISSSNHEMTSKIAQTFYGVGALGSSGTVADKAAAIQSHATACISMIGGYDARYPYDGQVGQNGSSYSTGIAYGATLWTGNIAKTINANGSFTTDNNSTFTTYYNALIGGIGGTTANIASSSWGSSASGTNAAAQSSARQLSSGLTYDAISIDAIVAASHKLICVAAGNNGGQGNGNAAQAILRTPGSPASGNNAFVVGASGTNNVANPSAAFTARASFSAYGPSAALVASTGQGGTIINESIAKRARVDILAPGQGIVGASNSGPGYYTGGDGTSFATPIVAGGAALIEDAGMALGYTNVTDNRVVVAILQNSATKLAGWTNNSSTVAGVQRTTQALDFQQGAGEMNLTKAYDQLTAPTHDLSGVATKTVAQGGTVTFAKGWDYGELSIGATNTYAMYLAPGAFTSTLRFDSGATYGTLGANNTVTDSALQFQYLSDFSLQLYQVTGLTSTLVAESNAAYITSEHFVYNITSAGKYQLRVNYLGDVYNLVGSHGAVGYGAAWSGTQAVPEPSSVAALALGALAMLRRRRKSA